MSMIGFPLLLIPLAIYNIFVFLLRTSAEEFGKPFASFKLQLASGQAWTATIGDALVALGILLLMLEVIKAAKPGAKYFTDHLLSLLVFAAAAAEFVMLPQFATSTFFLLTVLALVDFLASVAIRSRRKVPAAAMAPVKSGKRREAPAPEPKFEPSAATDLVSPVAAEPEKQPVLTPEPGPSAPAASEGASPDERRDPAVQAPPR